MLSLKFKYIVLSVLTLCGAYNIAEADDERKITIKLEGGISSAGKSGTLEVVGNTGSFGVLDSEVLGAGSVAGISIGYEVIENLHAEVSASIRQGYEYNTFDPADGGTQLTSKISAKTLMMGLSYDVYEFEVFDRGVVFSINGGAGYSIVQTRDQLVTIGEATDDLVFKDDIRRGFTWSVGMDISTKLTEEIFAGIGYRYIDVGEFEVVSEVVSPFNAVSQSPGIGDIAAHEVLLHIGYRF